MNFIHEKRSERYGNGFVRMNPLICFFYRDESTCDILSSVRYVNNKMAKKGKRMFLYKRCTEVDTDAIYEAFIAGFSDYIIKMDMSKDNFQKRFFGPEGNSPEYSVIAFDDHKPVGLILGGIKDYEGLKTLRCGALCVLPDYRGTGVSHKLFDLHREIAQENNCSQMLLEVIAGNERAINFYRKKGYKKVYDLVYYSHSNPYGINTDLPSGFTVKRTDIDTLRSFSREIRDIHINWQNDFDYTSHFYEQIYYGVFKDTNMVGGLSIHPAGRVNFLWVDPGFRNKGIGRGLINHAVKEINLKKLAISFPSNASLTGFVKRLGFMKDPITQYEMYLLL